MYRNVNSFFYLLSLLPCKAESLGHNCSTLCPSTSFAREYYDGIVGWLVPTIGLQKQFVGQVESPFQIGHY